MFPASQWPSANAWLDNGDLRRWKYFLDNFRWDLSVPLPCSFSEWGLGYLKDTQALQITTFQTARKSEQLQALQSLRCGYFWRKEHAMKTNLSDHVEECRFCNWLKLVLSPQNSDFGWEEPSIKVHSKARYFNKRNAVSTYPSSWHIMSLPTHL